MWADLTKGSLVTMYKVSLRTKTCNRVMFSVNSDFASFVPVVSSQHPDQVWNPESMPVLQTRKNSYAVAMFTDIIMEGLWAIFSQLHRVYFRTLSKRVSGKGAAIQAQQVQKRAHLLCFHPVPLTQNQQIATSGPFDKSTHIWCISEMWTPLYNQDLLSF